MIKFLTLWFVLVLIPQRLFALEPQLITPEEISMNADVYLRNILDRYVEVKWHLKKGAGLFDLNKYQARLDLRELFVELFDDANKQFSKKTGKSTFDFWKEESIMPYLSLDGFVTKMNQVVDSASSDTARDLLETFKLDYSNTQKFNELMKRIFNRTARFPFNEDYDFSIKKFEGLLPKPKVISEIVSVNTIGPCNFKNPLEEKRDRVIRELSSLRLSMNIKDDFQVYVDYMKEHYSLEHQVKDFERWLAYYKGIRSEHRVD